VSSPVNKAKFTGSTLADTFELYGSAACKGAVSYRNGAGTFTLTPRTVKSYKVY
jgi:hypothetical protein